MIELHDWQEKLFAIISTADAGAQQSGHMLNRRLEQGELVVNAKATDQLIEAIRKAGFMCTMNVVTGTHFYHLPDEHRGVMHCRRQPSQDHLWGYYNHDK